jgi:hypothetical protein
MSTKTVYQTSPDGWYLGLAIAFESPLEPGVFHIPAGCVEERPPGAPAGHWPKWTDAGWTIEALPPPEETPEPLPPGMPTISDRQFFQGLAESEVISWAEAEAAVGPGTIPTELLGYLNEIPDENDRRRARMKVIGATTFRFDDPLVPLIAAKKGWDEARLREFWTFCAALA